MISKLGKPYFKDSFSLSETLTEMRSPLLSYVKKYDGINIKELWWEDGDYYITCWLRMKGKDWVVLEAIRWQKGIKF